MIPLDEHGAVAPTNHSELLRHIDRLAKNGGLPKQFDTAEKAYAGWHFANALGLAPQIAMRQIAIINGTPSIWGDLPLALVRKTGELEFFEEYLVDKDYKKISFENKNLQVEFFAGVCEIKRAKFDKKTFHFTVEQAKTAGLWKKAGPWCTYPDVMIKMRARSVALKTEFGDALNGVAIQEYDFADVGGRTVSEESHADELNKTFGAKDVTEPATN